MLSGPVFVNTSFQSHSHMLPDTWQNLLFLTQAVFSSLRLLCFDEHATWPPGRTTSFCSGILTEAESSLFRVLCADPFGVTISPLLVMVHFCTGAKGILIAPRMRTLSPLPSFAIVVRH